MLTLSTLICVLNKNYIFVCLLPVTAVTIGTLDTPPSKTHTHFLIVYIKLASCCIKRGDCPNMLITTRKICCYRRRMNLMFNQSIHFFFNLEERLR